MAYRKSYYHTPGGSMRYLKSAGRDKGRNALGKFECDCGVIFTARVYDVENGHTNSCGCFKIEKLKIRHENAKKVILS